MSLEVWNGNVGNCIFFSELNLFREIFTKSLINIDTVEKLGQEINKQTNKNRRKGKNHLPVRVAIKFTLYSFSFFYRLSDKMTIIMMGKQKIDTIFLYFFLDKSIFK